MPLPPGQSKLAMCICNLLMLFGAGAAFCSLSEALGKNLFLRTMMVIEVSLLCFLPIIFFFFPQTENLENGNGGERKSDTEQTQNFVLKPL